MAIRNSAGTGVAKAARLVAGGALALLLSTSLTQAQENPVEVPQGQDELFSARVLTTGLSNPWEITLGPDNLIWVTERSSGEVTRVDPFTGAQQTLLTLEDFSVDVQHQGLLGMALHPELLTGTGNDYVYLVHTYETGTAEAPDPRAKLVRYTYDEANQQLIDPVDLLTGVPAWNDHNAGRVKVGPDMKLYYTIGEQGSNFGGNYQRPNHAQLLPTQEQVDAKDWEAYSGKVLRLELDGSIPDDNPEIEGVRSHIFTYGHRNPQGIDFGPDGTIYVSEHGPDTDDELNILHAGGNYGWPNVAGFVDDKAYVYANWSEAPQDLRYSGRNIPDAVPQYPETEFDQDIIEPIATYWTVDNDFDFAGGCGWICNPTIAPGSLEYYAAGEDGIAEWDNSILLPTLKHGVLYVQHLTEDGQAVDGLPTAWFSTQNRYRDTTMSEDNRTVFIATDGFGTGAEKFGETGFTNVLHNPGAILMFTYGGEEGVSDSITLAPAADDGAAGDEAAVAPAEDAEASDQTAAVADDDADFDTLYAQGQTLFGTTCAACHGPAGQGAQGPALAGNEALGDTAYLATTVVHGFGYMPPFGYLENEQIASITTYIRNSWGNEFGILTPDDVAAQR
ncbi:MAG TPA: glucose/sorbosone family PQQ-dependent dehydrogenase [Pelagibacterium sp.]|uniref:glucose/sorbosone family PQQ-dependent dehydrogenase n=1 Tax=Pelagibacterium sp. TaxID=1967288 RepID=UPI002D0B2F2F|nr:glucose/sorbosone family PQQ-dependent dehydrogenase [Pelagibacterium sp.]HWJ87636.1 glucose/sorbosone family PQQ-dependent dehydrogenase [Pelagibacterium sp.]